jgi:hypothetical protein
MQSLTFYEYDTVTALSVLPIGQVAPASSDDTALRLYNTSDIYQAQAVTVTLTGDDAIQLWLSTDGDTFGPAISVGDIPPNALSPIAYNTSTNVVSVNADAVSWTGLAVTTRYAVIYRSSNTNANSKLIGLIDFGADRTYDTETFQLSFPNGVVNVSAA